MDILVGNVWLDGCLPGDRVAHCPGACVEGIVHIHATHVSARGLASLERNDQVVDGVAPERLAHSVTYRIFESVDCWLFLLFGLHGPALCVD